VSKECGASGGARTITGGKWRFKPKCGSQAMNKGNDDRAITGETGWGKGKKVEDQVRRGMETWLTGGTTDRPKKKGRGKGAKTGHTEGNPLTRATIKDKKKSNRWGQGTPEKKLKR